MADRIQHRRDTAENWAKINPVLLEGEVGYVTDNPNQYKLGDGEHAWNDLPFRGFTGTISQETGEDENAVMSQKVVTEKLSELGNNSNNQVFTNSTLANTVFKELYLYKSNGEQITNDLFVSKIVNDTTYNEESNISSIVISDGEKNVCAIYQSEAIPSNDIIELTERSESGIFGYAVLDMCNLAKGIYNLNAKIKNTAYNYNFNPYIYSHFGIAKNAKETAKNAKEIAKNAKEIANTYSKFYEDAKALLSTKNGQG